MVVKLHEKSNTKGVNMYIVTGKKKNHKFKLRLKTLSDAMRIADRRIEEGYEKVKIVVYSEQMPLFDGEYDDCR